ncbi:CotH kinase family protein [Jeotgalibaca dankookensis]|uniref:CotH kinase family protein n=1 Tax=Jeotgalibaca dankookensis TaxID=708126 RepID=UPI0007831339|nr:CotH kinase family protein [Jeotgalibaca dankookensis]
MKQTFYRKKRKTSYFLFLGLISTLLVFILFVSLTPPLNEADEPGKRIPDSNVSTEIKENNLPIIVIDTKGQTIEANLEKEKVEINGLVRELRKATEKYEANMKLYEPNASGYTEIGENAKPSVETNITLNIRGQSSLTYDKKQYTIRLVDEDNEKNPQTLLGMKKHDKWVLNGMYSDKSLIRNYLAYKIGRDTMEYSPDTRFVEVYFKDGTSESPSENTYMGVYLLTEKIERGKNRVAIDKNSTDYKDISFIISRDKIKLGDTILKSDWNKIEEDYVIDGHNNVRARTVFTTTYPSKNTITQTDQESIVNYLNLFEYSLRSTGFDDVRGGYRDYIDTTSFINFAMINEVMKNIDGGEVSTYFHKDIGGLMKAGPIWDFDQSAGNTPLEEVNEPTGFRMTNVIWFERLFQDPAFVKQYQRMYRHYRNTIWTNKNFDDLIDEAVLELGPSIDRNREKWYPEDSAKDYQNEIEAMKLFFKERLSWIDQNIHLVSRIKENAVE